MRVEPATVAQSQLDESELETSLRRAIVVILFFFSQERIKRNAT